LKNSELATIKNKYKNLQGGEEWSMRKCARLDDEQWQKAK